MEVQKWPSKIILAPSIEKGLEMPPAESSDSISRNIVSGKRVADRRFLGMKVLASGGGLPMGEP